MEHESFENESVASVMNEYYVNVKGNTQNRFIATKLLT